MVQVTSHKILVAIRGLFAHYSKTFEWISMKFSEEIEDGTSKEPLNFGNDPWPWQRFMLSELRFALCEWRFALSECF